MSNSTELGRASSAFPIEDIKSGFLVFLIALPLCLGIALASGFPPVAGVLTAVIGGTVVSFLGSAELTIKGPAAGLIVIALGAVHELGQGDPLLGYKRALAVGVVAALVQIGFALFRAATVGIAMSPSVVHGMLAAIGVIIVSGQAHTVIGVRPEGHEPLELLAEIPHSLAHANPDILVIGLISLIILFGMPLLRFKWVKAIPAPMVVLAVTVPLGLFFGLDHEHLYTFWNTPHHVGPGYLVSLPGSLMEAITFPDFSVITSAASMKYVAMYALVGTIESTLSVLAVDSMDPEKHTSNLNRDLLGVGIGNLISASIGGLPMISEIVRSKANVDAGAKSRWSNFSHGAFLFVFVAAVPNLLHHIPLAALAAMLVFTGARLASPAELWQTKSIGIDQLLLFVTTLVVTLATDLLVGVGVGLTLKIILHWARGASPAQLMTTRIEREEGESELRLKLRGPAAFSTLLKVRAELGGLPPSIDRLVIDLSECPLADHTFLSRIESMAAEVDVAEFTIVGLDEMKASSSHPHSTHRRPA